MTQATTQEIFKEKSSSQMKPFSLTVDKEGIAHLVFDLKGEKVNKLSLEVLTELEKTIEEASSDKNIQALILKSAKPGIFIAGADLESFKKAENDPEIIEDLIRTGHRVFDKLEKLPFPTIALIDGTCLGGGTECALACTYRIATDNPKTQIGLPEVNLGIFPGWGGTQRVPRLIGLQESLKMILTGKPMDGLKAFKIGLIDGYVPQYFAEERAIEFVSKILTKKGKDKVLAKRNRGGLMNWLLEKNPLGRKLVFNQSRKNVLKATKGHYPAPLVALQIIKETYSMPLEKGLVYEQEAFNRLLDKDFEIAANLVNLFFISEALKKQPEATAATPKKVSTAGVIGAGTMGGGIAWLFSYRGYDIHMKDINWDQVAIGYSSAKDIYDQLVKKRKLKPFEAGMRFHKIGGTVSYESFKGVDLIVEAAVENLEIKRQIFAELEEYIRDDVIIGSNTSSLTIADMSRDMKHPERFVGMHFFNPVNRMPLVEIVAGPKSSPEAIATAIKICQDLKKTPIVVGDCPGFLVNRTFMAGANEIIRILEEGVPPKKIEEAMLDFGMPMSPFLLVDEIGIDVTLKVAQTLYKAYGDRMAVPKILEELAAKGFLGKKVGKGFYIHKGKETTLNPEAMALIKAKGRELKDEDILHRSLLLMINEGARCLDEGIVKNPGFLDMAMITGTGFPPFRGGLMRYADSLGVSWVTRRLEELAEKYGSRFKPCELMEKWDYEGRRFY